MNILRVIRKFGSIFSKHQKARIMQLVILMVLGGLLETCSVSLILPFVNAIMNPDALMENRYVQVLMDMLHIGSASGFLVVLAVALAVLYILKNVYLLFEYNMQYRFVYRNMFDLQKRLLHSILNRPYEFFFKADSGELIRLITSDAADAFSTLSTLLMLLTESIVSLMLIAVVFAIAPFVTLAIAFVLFTLMLVINSAVKPKVRKASLYYQDASAGLNRWLLQSVEGMKEIKVMQKEKFFEDNFERYGRIRVDALRNFNVLSFCPRFLIEAVSMSVLFLMAAVLILNGEEIESLVPVVSAVAAAAVRLMPSVNRISNSLAAVSYGEPRLDNLIKNLEDLSGSADVLPETHSVSEQKKGQKETVPELRDNISLCHVTYRYPQAAENVLQDASMTVRYGESVGIVGNSGAGKTTAVDIILGLMHVQAGSVRIDGVDISKDLQGWLGQAGYIPQTIFMLNDSIRANIAFGVLENEISEEAVWRALKEASLDEFVRGLPEGLDTQIGERGIRLSGGQRQRIGIARALYRNPRVLILDEATSALDHETEADIMESMKNLMGKKTMIIIAHRLSTIESCDHIYRVENGRLLLER